MEAVLERPEATVNKQRRAVTSEQSIRDRTLRAARLYLEKRGYEVMQKWESDSQLGFIVKDDKAIAFVHVVSNGLDKKGFSSKPSMTRKEFEEAAMWWFTESGHEHVDMPVRFDELSLKVLCADRALIRHHINALGVS